MDKNKSIYKLKGLPPIYYLNLDGQPERAQYMEDQFKYWERVNAKNAAQKEINDTKPKRESARRVTFYNNSK